MKSTFLYIAILVLSALLALSLWRNAKSKRSVMEVVERVRIDTFTMVVRDTIRLVEPTFVSQVVVDTIFVEKAPENGLFLPIIQKHYGDSLYDAWVSGYRPALDSIHVYPMTVTRTVTRDVEREVARKTFDVYLRAGGYVAGGNVVPYIGTMLKFKNDLTIGADIGYMDGKPLYGLSIGMKINK